MALHDELLGLARRLVPAPTLAPHPTHPSVPSPLGVPPMLSINEADLRRGVSTAYYALFHLLIHEAMARIVADPGLRPRVGRIFDHTRMRQLCEEYSSAKSVARVLTVRGIAIAPQLQDIGTAFVDLQDARHDADYDTATSLNHTDADFKVLIAENAFLDWTTCQGDPSSDVFLTNLFLKSVLKR